MQTILRRAVTGLIAVVFAGALTACPEQDPAAEPEPEDPGLPAAQQTFWDNLQELCGNAYPGTLAEAPAGDETFAGRDLVMHVRECDQDEVRIPFHVGENRSRTWVVSRLDDRLRLKHDHRHEDGVEEELTWYGGDTDEAGTATVQEFPADEETADMLPEAAANVWTLELRPEEEFVYALRREGTDRRFRIEFDLTETVDPVPPAPWGFEENGEALPADEPEEEDEEVEADEGV